MRNYELTLIFDAKLGTEQLAQALEDVIAFIQGKGGILLHHDIVGKKALLAPIGTHREGNLAVIRFTMDALYMKEMEKYLKENTKILRSLCLIVVSRKVRGKTPHLAPSLANLGTEPSGRMSIPLTLNEETGTQKIDLGEIDKKLEEIFKQP